MMLAGHEHAWQEWRSAMAGTRMHHAWILGGIKGLGKGTFAREAAAMLVGTPGAAGIDVDHHPDILVLDHLPANDDEDKKREEGKPWQRKRNITIDQIRRMQQRLTTRPTLGERRVVIIDPADDMEKPAVNALLKSLEEPPQGTFFVLVAHRPGRLLPTVRSRCRTLRFSPLDDTALDAVLRQHAPAASEAQRHAAITAAEGSAGRALEFVEHDLAALHSAMQQLVSAGDPGLSLRGALVDELGARPSRERLLATIDLARTVLARELGGAGRNRQARIIAAHNGLTRLGLEAPTYNYDAGLLLLEIGGLLASVSLPRETAG